MPDTLIKSLIRGVRYDKVYPSRDFYIDPVLGADKNSGTQGNPIKSLDEVARRLHGHNIPGQVKLYLLNNTIDVATFTVDTGWSGLVEIRGVRTLIDSGEITAIQNYNIATKADQRITDSTLPTSWTDSGFIGKMIVLTSGDNEGSYAWVHEDLGSKEAIVSPFYNPSTGGWIEPIVGDTYSVYSLTKVSGAILGRAGFNGLALYDLHIEFDENAWVDPLYINGGWFYMYGCLIDGMDDAGDPNDAYGHLMLNEGCVGYIYGSWIKAHIRSNSGSYLSLGCNLFTGWGTAPTADGGDSTVNIILPCTGYGEQTFLQARNSGKAIIETNSWYMVANQAYGLYVRDNGTAQLKGKIWGYGITDFGVHMGADATVTYATDQIPDLVNDPVTPTYPTSQIDLGGVSISFATITNTSGAENISNGAQIVPSYIPD